MTVEIADDDRVTVEVAFPEPLLQEMDAYARVRGHVTRSGVVREALDE